MELVLIVKRSIIYILSILSIPHQLTFFPRPMKKISFKSVVLSSFKSFPVKFVILETSLVGELIRLESSIFTTGFILLELSLIKGTVGEDIGSFSTCSSIIKLPQEESSIFSEHRSKTVRSSSLHAQ